MNVLDPKRLSQAVFWLAVIGLTVIIAGIILGIVFLAREAFTL